MAETRIVTTAEPDQPAFAPDGADSRLIVTMSLEVRDIGATPDAAAEAAARDQFATFLEAVPGAALYAYRLPPKPADGSPWKMKPDAALGENKDGKLTVLGTPTSDLADNILHWIDRQIALYHEELKADPQGAPLSSQHCRGWITTAGPESGELDARQLSAGHLLLAAHGWDAPLAQDSGIVRTAVIGLADKDIKDLVIVPWFAGTTAVELDLTETPKGEAQFEYEPAPGLKIWSLARVVRERAEDPTSTVRPDGFVEMRADAGGLHRTLRRVSEQSASMLSVFPHLTGYAGGFTSDAPATEDDVRRATYFGVAGLATLTDPLMAGFTAAHDRREGPFVAALTTEVEQLIPGIADLSGLADAITGKLKDRLSGKTPLDLAKLLLAVTNTGPLPDVAEASETLLPALARLHIDGDVTLTREYQERFGNSLAQQASVELAAASQAFQTEEGMEKGALALLRELGVDKTFIADALHLTSAGDIESCSQALAAFTTLLADQINGADAGRFALGDAYARLLIQGAGPMTYLGLQTALGAKNWFAERLGLIEKPDSPFKDLLNYVATPKWGKPVIDAVTGDGKLEELLKTQFAAVADDLIPPPTTGRFIPDQTPQPLPVVIAVDPDTSDGDAFADTYSGIALLVRREKEKWAHANLARLQKYDHTDPAVPPKPPVDQYAPVEGNTIHPLLPMAIDGQRALFVNYDGIPLASNAFAGTTAPGNETDGTFVPFELFDAPGELDKSIPRLPGLYYGRNYEVAAFALGRGGALPDVLQANAAEPWLPKTDIADKAPPSTAPYSYRRTTAIGRMTISDADRAIQRIGKAIEGVQPLFRDYPRAGLTANGDTQLDLCRNPDGSGTIGLPAADGETITFTLGDLWCWGPNGAGGKLEVELHEDRAAALDAKPVRTWSISLKPSVLGPLTLKATRNDAQNVTLTLSPPDDPNPEDPGKLPKSAFTGKAAWLRLKLTGVTQGKELALSFADPAAGGTSDYATARPGAESLLLLAPPGVANEWLAPDTNGVTGLIDLPRVGFLDFDRWVGDLEATATKTKADGTVPIAKVDDLRRALTTVYVGRALDEQLSPLVDALPDPAVTRLLVELTPLDTLSAAPSTALAIAAGGLVAEVPMSSIDKDLAGNTIHARLKNLGARHHAALRVTSGGPDLTLSATPDGTASQARITINVPRGMVARLSVRPMVRADLVGAVFDEGMRGLARQKRGDYLVFEGTALVVEAMLGAPAIEHTAGAPQPWQQKLDEFGRAPEWEKLVARTIDIVPAGRQRQYSLAATPPANATDAWRWRMLGSVDVQTQRWRFGGRPIYSWLDPKAGLETVGSVAVRQKNNDALARFEDEAFFDRDDKDVDIQTTRLDPAPATTVLQQFPWEPPSATFFRHRVSVRSRYAGALHPTARSVVRAWGDDTPGAADAWIRVAMLADRTRLQLTRPQLRALLPLTTSPRLAETEPFTATPPVLAVLDERPFVLGGLAERVGAEIKTSIGYDLPENLLGVSDTRKQIGPDPRLSYSPTEHEDALSVTLRPEGPVGLTFDDDSIRAPAFANTAIVLTPELLRDEAARPGSLEEHFLSVGLRRYLDPRWLVPEAVKASQCPPAETWWAETVDGGDLTLAARTKQEVDDNAPGSPICKVRVDGQNWVVTVPAGVLLPGYIPQTGEPGDITIAKLAKSKAAGIALQHLALEEGRASLAVFAVQDGTARGASGVGQTNQPLMVASVEWVVPTETATLFFAGGTVQATSASPTTLMNWTRTGTAFDALRHRPGGMAELEAIDAAGIEVRLDNKTDPNAPDSWRFVRRSTGTPLNPEPSKFDYPHPLYVHRHQAVIGTRLAAGLGRPLDVFDNAVRLFPGGFALSKDTRSVRLVEFEMPARPLAGNLPSWDGMASVRTVRFDLYSIFGERFSADPAKAPTGFSLYLRLVGDTRTKLTSLDLKLSLHIRGADKTTDIKLQRKTTDKDVMWRALRLDVTAAGGLTGRIIRSDGTDDLPPTATPKLTAFEMADLDHVELTVNSAATAGEFWCDVSLLSLASSGTAQGFDFGWFFTGTGLAPGEAVSAASLRMMTEAQARIIAVSPPMPVVATK